MPSPTVEFKPPLLSSARRRLPVGAESQPGGGVHFRVWAPTPHSISLVTEQEGRTRDCALERDTRGYCEAFVGDAGAGTRYWFRVDGELLPDPGSRYQPDGAFGPSMVVDAGRYTWSSAPAGVSMRGQVLYELHVGSFTREGTWRSAAEKLPLLARTGITGIELMPIAEFPGRFGWGYDGVFPYAPARLYGTPDDLRGFVDVAHQLGMAVILDVVYNHLGPDGCVFARYASDYFARRATEWGDGLNFDGPNSDPVREYFSSNAAYWIDEYRLDGLRLDATQSIHDSSGDHVIALIGRCARAAAGDRQIILIAENEPQDVRLIRPLEDGGYGLDGLWNDDFHHSAHVAMTGRREAYFSDHGGTPQEFVSAAKYGYLFQGQRYAWQKQPRGTRARGVDPAAFVNFIENHDQLANAGDGSRSHQTSTPGRYRAMSALFILLEAEFLAVVNVIVYAGAIMVLFLFVIMLMNLNASIEPQRNFLLKLAGIIAGGLLLSIMISAVRSAGELTGKQATMNEGDIGLIENLGKVLFTQYVVPFEISSILFLSAMVGAVVIGKKEESLPK